ncbi:TerB family tellurite resistance protein [Zeaxanthinibacter sp. PT1]|uniref:tellurite resistance TerB family protein n=1 Tax=Zeaxanthinibacter TaxID=561554 RepID=UPI00234A293D|nr:TerB family tellurite resistance protein [Zeaxanthinibacter sp. PT1]MDC6350328.1 TerB family tellurite resistance protein [Zeaxanthinibacter sp. PT1]
MGFLDLFDSGFRKRNQDHFAAIVRVAMSDGIISGEEKMFLDRLAANLHISEDEYNKILEDYASHPINPPNSYDERLERLYDLARMVYADHNLGDKQTGMLKRLGVGLGFTPANVGYVVDKALKLVQAGVDLDTFTQEIRFMNH